MSTLHTIARPEHSAALAQLLAVLNTAKRTGPVPLPDGTVTGKRIGAHTPSRAFDRIAVYADDRTDRAALLTASGADAATLGAIVAAITANAPRNTEGRAAAGLSAESLHTVSGMRRDNRTPARRTDGSACWTVPGARIVMEWWAITIRTDTASVRIVLDGPEWTVSAAAAVLDAALWWMAPAARHMTRTTPGHGRRRLSDVIPGAIGRDRSGGTFADTLSTAFCSCGWSSLLDDRPMARAAARRHIDSEQRKTEPAAVMEPATV